MYTHGGRIQNAFADVRERAGGGGGGGLALPSLAAGLRLTGSTGSALSLSLPPLLSTSVTRNFDELIAVAECVRECASGARRDARGIPRPMKFRVNMLPAAAASRARARAIERTRGVFPALKSGGDLARARARSQKFHRSYFPRRRRRGRRVCILITRGSARRAGA